MFKIWAKIYKDNRIIKNHLFRFDMPFNENDLFDYVQPICTSFNIETPIILKKHINNSLEYNYVKFIKDDFIDEIKFDSFVLEYEH